MGDILHALPAVTALRMAHPGWMIDWVVEPGGVRCWRPKEVPAVTPAAQRRDAAGRRPPALRAIQAMAQNALSRARLAAKSTRFAARSKSEHYDAVLDLQGAMRSAVIGRMAGSRRFIGESEPRERAARWLFTERVDTHARARH